MFFRRRPQDFGWTTSVSQAAGTAAAWSSQTSPAWRSPAQVPGHAVLRSREGSVEVLSGREFHRPGDLYQVVDLRRRQLSLAPQSIPTAEGLDVVLTLVLSIRVSDPVAFVSASQSPEDEVYLAAQIALRDLISQTSLADLVGTRIELGTVARAAAEAGRGIGLDVSESVQLKDISLPHTYTQAIEASLVAEVTARTDLERARTEVKTTRARLGTAKVLEQNPLLAKLRLLEALPSGTTLEIRGDAER